MLEKLLKINPKNMISGFKKVYGILENLSCKKSKLIKTLYNNSRKLLLVFSSSVYSIETFYMYIVPNI